MGNVLGGDSKSRTSSITNVDSSTSVQGAGMGSTVTGDKSQYLSDSATIWTDNRKQSISGSGTVNVLDGDAIADAFMFARETREQASQNFADVIGWGAQMELNRQEDRNKLLEFSDSTIQKASDNVKSAYATANQKAEPINMNYVAYSVALVVGIFVWRKFSQ
jgi:hypothetical protein